MGSDASETITINVRMLPEVTAQYQHLTRFQRTKAGQYFGRTCTIKAKISDTIAVVKKKIAAQHGCAPPEMLRKGGTPEGIVLEVR